MGLFNRFYAKETVASASVAELKPRGDSYVRIDGADHGIRAWSPTGFLIAPYSGALVVGQIARVRFVLREFQESEGEFRIDDQVVIDCIDEAGLRARWWYLPARKKAEVVACFTRKAAISP